MWIFIAPVDNIIISVSSFSLENGVDFVYIGAGSNPSVGQLHALTGESVPSPITVSDITMWMYFGSDSLNADQGFEIQITYSSLDI